MKGFLAVVLAWLALPGTAHAGVATIVARELPVADARLPAGVRAPGTFDLVGLHWQGPGGVLFRTRSLGGRWSAWQRADADDHVSPNSREGALSRRWHLGEPYWTGPSDRLDYRVLGRVRRLRAYYVWSPVEAAPYRTVSIAGSPQIIPRAAWRADEEIRREAPHYASSVHFAVVHHTAGTNNYGPLQSAAIVRGIELYHVRGNGWDDIGYNFLVDRYGQIFEGRYGGIDRNVIGAHAAGFNTGSVGVAVIGNFSSRPPPDAAQQALVNLLAWRLDVAHVDPVSTLTWRSRGNSRFRAGAPVFLRAISGHRATGYTDCPGTAFYRLLDGIAARVAGTGLPKLYAPVVQGKLGGPIQFTARLSSTLPWSVTVSSSGRAVAQGTGYGSTVFWTWDSTRAPEQRYTWTIEAGTGVRPASGVIGQGPVVPPPPAVLRGLALTPAAISPNGDGFGDAATVSYTLGARATVTAVIKDASGAVVATRFSNQMQSARQISFPLTVDQLVDGTYVLSVTAIAEDGREAAADAPILVDRALASLTASPSPLSPNGGTISFSFLLAKPAQVTVTVFQGGLPLAVVFEGLLQPGSQSIPWGGQLPGGPAPAGHYDVVVTATDDVGQISQSAGFDVASLGG